MNYDGKTYRNLEGQVAYLTEVAGALDNRITEVAANIPSKMIVEELPEEGDPLITYYVGPKGTEPNQYYEVWVWVQEEPDGPFVWRELEDTDQVDLSGYLEKDETASTYAQLYMKATDGSQVMVNATSGLVGGAVPVRNADSQINVPETPSANNHATSKKYVDDGFVAKNTVTGTATQVYGKVGTDGSQTMIDVYQNSATANSLVRRDSTGKIVCADPTANNHAATKGYADTNYLAKQTGATTYAQAYVKNADGTQALVNIAPNYQEGSTIVQRTAYGQIYVAETPTVGGHATSKAYVDGRKTNLYMHTLSIVYEDVGNDVSFQLFFRTYNPIASAYTSIIPSTIPWVFVGRYADNSAYLTISGADLSVMHANMFYDINNAKLMFYILDETGNTHTYDPYATGVSFSVSDTVLQYTTA